MAEYMDAQPSLESKAAAMRPRNAGMGSDHVAGDRNSVPPQCFSDANMVGRSWHATMESV